MFRKLFIAFTAFFLLPILLVAQDGKLRGKVTDRESGEALIGANVVLDGTNLGASTDINGEYIILSVPPGVYTVRGSYIGYSSFTITNVRVSSNITTTQDFRLSSTAIQVQGVEVVADRPLIQRNTTNTVRINTQENLKNLPLRGLQNIIALEAGVVQQGGNLYVRGGRAGEVAYYIDGANTTNPIFNSQNVGVIQEALEEFQLQTGGYTAEFGGASAGSGIIRTSVRTGGSSLKATIDYQTDDFAKPGEQFLNTSSFGYRNGVLTIGGPLFSGARIFVAGQHNYLRNRQQMFLEPFRFDSLRTDALGSRPEGELLPGPVELKRNYLYNNWSMNNSGQGTVLFDMNQLADVPIKLRFPGSYAFNRVPGGGSWPGALGNIYSKPSRYTWNDTETMFGNLRATHVLSATTFYEVGVSYQNRSAKSYDQDFKDDWKSYPDSVANAALGFTGWRTRYDGPLGYSTIFNFGFAHPDAPNNGYSKNSQWSIGATFDFTSQINPNWELKAGGGLESWVYRTFGVGSITGYLKFLDTNGDGVTDRTFASDFERYVRLNRAGGITQIGYDIDGNELDSGPLAPKKPLFANAYIQNKFEFNDLILNVGARFEFLDPKGSSIRKTLNPATGAEDFQEPVIDQTLGVIPDDQFVDTDPFSFLLPRVSFSFPVTDRTVFYALYGKYVNMPSLNQMYIDNVTLSGLVNPSTRSPYNLFGTTVGFMIKPERNTQYEVGLRQTLSDNFAFTVTGFYKDLRDQIQIRRVFNSGGLPIFTALSNEDFGTVKGVELTLELRRTNRLAAKVNYTLSDARGTGSNSRSSNNAVTDEASARFPNFINPVDYNQQHKGSVLLDYRFDKGDGGAILEGLGVNALLTFNSGHPYTKIKEPQNLGQATPWNIGVRSSIDSRSRNPVEPINSSTTPWVFNVDLNVNKVFFFGDFNVEVYSQILNLFDTRQIINVFPTTGTPDDDGWLKSPFSEAYKAIPNYETFYKAINIDNRWAALQARFFGSDVFGTPRQVRFGVKVEY